MTDDLDYESEGHPTMKAAFMDALAHIPEGTSIDIITHGPACRTEEIGLCTCEPTVYHHGHEADEDG